MKNKMTTLFLAITFCVLSVRSFAGNNEDLIAACRKGDVAAAQKAIDAGANVNFIDEGGGTPLTSAIFSPAVTQLLLDKKADPNLGTSPALVNAAGVGSYEVMQLLLKAGADPNKPLVIDLGAAYKKLIADEKAKGKAANKYIIKAYQDLLDKAGTGTPIYAIQHAVNKTICKECLELLISKGAKTDIINATSGGNLLDDLAFSYLPTADWIVNNKPQAEGWEKYGFVLPEWYKNPDANKPSAIDGMVKVLVKAGVNINAQNKMKQTPLLTSLARFSQTRSEVVLAFVNNGSDINVESVTHGHALLQAAGFGFVDVLEAMFAKGADMNREFKVDDYEKTMQRLKGITPLMWAAKSGSLEAVKYLHAKGAKINEGAYGTSVNAKTLCLTAVKNKTAIFYAIEAENMEIVKFLVENTSGNWSKKMTVDEFKEKETVNSGALGFRKETKMNCIGDKDYLPSEYATATKLDIRSYRDGKTQVESTADKKAAEKAQAATESDTLDPIIEYLKSKKL